MSTPSSFDAQALAIWEAQIENPGSDLWMWARPKVKVSLLVAEFLKSKGIRHVFGISGGASLHLIHGIVDTGLELICPQHEQACGFAADAYARIAGLGCAVATSGPGATNLITAIAASYYDSVPVLYITGQVTTFRMGNGKVRQAGFQETPIVQMCWPITKYAKTVMKAEDVIPTLEEAVMIAKSGRRGPVLVDLPDDIQRAEHWRG